MDHILTYLLQKGALWDIFWCIMRFERWVYLTHILHGNSTGTTAILKLVSSEWIHDYWTYVLKKKNRTIWQSFLLYWWDLADDWCPLQWRHNGRDSVSNHQPHDCLLNRLFRRRSRKTPKLRVTGLCAGNSPVTGEFPAQMASYAEKVSIWWRHHGCQRCWSKYEEEYHRQYTRFSKLAWGIVHGYVITSHRKIVCKYLFMVNRRDWVNMTSHDT